MAGEPIRSVFRALDKSLAIKNKSPLRVFGVLGGMCIIYLESYSSCFVQGNTFMYSFVFSQIIDALQNSSNVFRVSNKRPVRRDRFVPRRPCCCFQSGKMRNKSVILNSVLSSPRSSRLLQPEIHVQVSPAASKCQATSDMTCIPCLHAMHVMGD